MACGKWEAVAMKDNNGKCGRKKINDVKEIIEEDDKQSIFSFWINAINVRYRQLVKDILVNTRGPNMCIYRCYI